MNRTLKIIAAVGVFIIPLSVSVGSTAHAAPQVLAVMSSLGPQDMRCAGSTCTTTFSSYCLQRERDVPTTGQAYLPAHPDQFQLSVIAADGTATLLPAGDHVIFRSQRGYSAVSATLRRDDLTALGGVSAKIITAKGAALVPEPIAGDPNPISEAEIAFATKSLREHGEAIVDATPEAGAAMLVNRMAATIIPSAPVNTESLEQLWHDAVDGLGTYRPAGADAIKRARDIYEWCQGRMSYHSMAGIKSCLEFKHDNAIMRLNTDYWEKQPGY
tara:strand:+ start:684 stop:1499 length:816 start_codon:yes stop_codon:yes gene_type:complete